MKNNKGITLIALIITVILMLILASVALSAIGDAGLFEKTQNAADSYKEKADEEKALLESLINSVEKYAYVKDNNQEPEITTFTARFGSYCDGLPEDNYDEITVTGIGKASPIVSYEMYFVAQENGGNDEEFYGMLDFSTLKKSESSIKTYSSNMGLEKLALSSEPIVLAEADGTQPEILYSGTNVPYEEGTYNFNITIEEDHANWYDGYDKDFYIKITFADGSYIEKTIVPDFGQGC